MRNAKFAMLNLQNLNLQKLNLQKLNSLNSLSVGFRILFLLVPEVPDPKSVAGSLGPQALGPHTLGPRFGIAS